MLSDYYIIENPALTRVQSLVLEQVLSSRPFPYVKFPLHKHAAFGWELAISVVRFIFKVAFTKSCLSGNW